MGARVAVAGPATLLPPRVAELGVDVYTDLDLALRHADVVNVLRLQLERQKKGLFASAREYNEFWGLTPERLRASQPDLLVLHPGPMNRGVEITSEVADGPQAVILEQVKNGVAVRMAILYLLMGGGE